MSINQSGAAFGSNMNFSKAAVVAGTTTTLTSTVAAMFSIAGKLYTKAAFTNSASPTTDAVTGAAFVPLPIPTATVLPKQCLFVICLDTAGAIKVVQGPMVNAIDVTNKLSAVHFPSIPDTLCPIAYEMVTAASTQVATWTFGTNNHAGVTGITTAFADLSSIPGAPLTA